MSLEIFEAYAIGGTPYDPKHIIFVPKKSILGNRIPLRVFARMESDLERMGLEGLIYMYMGSGTDMFSNGWTFPGHRWLPIETARKITTIIIDHGRNRPSSTLAYIGPYHRASHCHRKLRASGPFYRMLGSRRGPMIPMKRDTDKMKNKIDTLKPNGC